MFPSEEKGALFSKILVANRGSFSFFYSFLHQSSLILPLFLFLFLSCFIFFSKIFCLFFLLGEIACRVMRTAKKAGIKTVAVYSDAGSFSPSSSLLFSFPFPFLSLPSSSQLTTISYSPSFPPSFSLQTRMLCTSTWLMRLTTLVPPSPQVFFFSFFFFFFFFPSSPFFDLLS